MNKTQFHSGCMFLLLALSSSIVFADDKLPDNAMPMSQLLQNLQKQAFMTVTKIEYNDGKYVAKAIDNEGSSTELDIAPQSGEIIKPKMEDRPKLSMSDAAQKVEQAGYHGIYYIKSTGKKYEFKAYDKSNKKVSIDIDAKTGEMKV